MIQKPLDKQNRSNRRVGIVGGGLVGSLMSVYLAKRGISSTIFEKRGDLRKNLAEEGRSINLALSTRGITALREVGLYDKVMEHAIPMFGRMIHPLADATGNVKPSLQRYGVKDSDCIYAISRAGLNRVLLDAAEDFSGPAQVEIKFMAAVTGLNLEGRGQTTVRTPGESSETFDFVLGTDGSASVVRDEILGRAGLRPHTEWAEYGYKELVMEAAPLGAYAMEKNALHIWPRGNFMLIALPNPDGSFTCTLFMPHEGPLSFQKIADPRDARKFFDEYFPDASLLLADLEASYASHPVGRMVTLGCDRWAFEDQAVILGDAAHAILPFFGQGMNCGFEDCRVLNALLDQHADLKSVFLEFERLRKPNADAIALMAQENFIEMRDKVGQTQFVLEKAVEKILLERFPKDFVSRYGLVTFTNVPYIRALEVGRIGDEILKALCAGIKNPEEADLGRARDLISEKFPGAI